MKKWLWKKAVKCSFKVFSHPHAELFSILLGKTVYLIWWIVMRLFYSCERFFSLCHLVYNHLPILWQEHDVFSDAWLPRPVHFRWHFVIRSYFLTLVIALKKYFSLALHHLFTMDSLQWMGAVRMRVQTSDKNIKIIHK